MIAKNSNFINKVNDYEKIFTFKINDGKIDSFELWLCILKLLYHLQLELKLV